MERSRPANEGVGVTQPPGGSAADCVVCGSTPSLIFNYKRHGYYRCPNCRIVSTYPLPDEAAIEAHYAAKFRKGNYQLLEEHFESYRRVYRDTVRRLQQYLEASGQTLQRRTVLDVGCFTGGFLMELTDAGADACGLELQPEAVELANRRLPGRIFQADVHGDAFPEGPYDVVSILGVVEHVVDPIGLLRRCFSVLTPGGVLLLQTPDSGSMPARTMGRFWPPYAPIEHIHLFSRKALRTALVEAGFERITCRRQWKRLPVEYVFHMTQNFGPGLHTLFKPGYRLLPKRLKKAALPFYVGGMTVMASRPRADAPPTPARQG